MALDKGNGRRIDGKRVVVDFERGRTREDWLPRRLGGGRGDSRRDRDEEKLIRELKRTHQELKSRSRSRSQRKTKAGEPKNEEDKENPVENNQHHKQAQREKEKQ